MKITAWNEYRKEIADMWLERYEMAEYDMFDNELETYMRERATRYQYMNNEYVPEPYRQTRIYVSIEPHGQTYSRRYVVFMHDKVISNNIDWVNIIPQSSA